MPELQANPKDVWFCKIGFADRAKLPLGADAPMRNAVEEAFYKLTGEYPEFIFSGWGQRLTEGELAVVEDRLPRDMPATVEVPTHPEA